MKHAHMLLFLVLVISMMNFHCTNAQITQPNPPFGFTFGENLKASLSVIIIAFFSALVFMGIFSLYLRHCSYNNQYGSINHRNPIAVAAELCRRGFNRHLIDKCPILIYSMVKDLKIGKGTLECAVCLNEFEDNDEIRLLPKCYHVFHLHCIDVWLLSHMNCPVCRSRLTSDMANIAIATPILTSNTENNQTTTTPEHGRGHETENEQHQHVEEEEKEERESSTITGTEESVTPDISVMTQTVPSLESRITFGKFLLRSHSTGHSLVEEPEEKVKVAVDRHTLRLPEHVRKQILVDHERIRSLTRSDVVLPGLWSSKRTLYKSNNNNNNLEWCSSMTPPFVSIRWGETTCWTPLRMSFYKSEGPQKPLHVLPV